MSRSAIYRPKVQNGQVASRRAVNRGVSRNGEQTAKRGKSLASEGTVAHEGTTVLYAVIGIGLLLSVGFISALMTQGRIYRLGIDDTKLKSELHEVANRQRAESLEQQKALHQADTAALLQPDALAGTAGRQAGVAPAPDVSAVADDTDDTDQMVTGGEKASARPSRPTSGDRVAAVRGQRPGRSVARSGGEKRERRGGSSAGTAGRRSAANSDGRRVVASVVRKVGRNGERNIARDSSRQSGR